MTSIPTSSSVGKLKLIFTRKTWKFYVSNQGKKVFQGEGNDQSFLLNRRKGKCGASKAY
jgi:hypothetical protein